MWCCCKSHVMLFIFDALLRRCYWQINMNWDFWRLYSGFFRFYFSSCIRFIFYYEWPKRMKFVLKVTVMYNCWWDSNSSKILKKMKLLKMKWNCPGRFSGTLNWSPLRQMQVSRTTIHLSDHCFFFIQALKQTPKVPCMSFVEVDLFIRIWVLKMYKSNSHSFFREDFHSDA